MPDHAQRKRPVCGSEFMPLTVRASACNKTCAKHAAYLRTTGHAYDHGDANITLPALEILLRVREMDELIALALEKVAVAKQEAADEAEWKTERQVQDDWNEKTAKLMRSHRERMIARGWRPISIGAKPLGERKRFTLNFTRPMHSNGRKMQSDEA